jgi:GNAT superfamily N-acetyltransferase
MALVVRPLRGDEVDAYVAIVNAAIRGLATTHYDAGVIDGWALPPDPEAIEAVARNGDGEIRLAVELDGRLAGVGALVPHESELRACYVHPAAARRGCGAALVAALERLARAHRIRTLEVTASLNAEAFYARLGYRVRDRADIRLRNGVRMAAVFMEKRLDEGPVTSRDSASRSS